MSRYSFTRISGNRKTGAIPTTTTTSETCPDSCALKGAGCYAESGHVMMHWKLLDRGTRPGFDLDQLCGLIRSLPGASLWRHNVAGDLPGDNETIDAAALAKITRAARKTRGFTYTHKPKTAHNLKAIRAANADGFTINLSADNAKQADIMARHKLPIVAIIPDDAPKVSFTPRGQKIVHCPAENSDRITCANCGLCAIATRPYIIGFKPKGAKRRAVNTIARGTT